MSQEDLELAKRGYAAFRDGDMATVRDTFHEDISWVMPGKNRLSGTYEGQEEVFGLIAQVVQATGGTLHQEIHDMLESDDHVVVLLKVSASSGDKSAESHQVHVLHTEDGKLKSMWIMSDDQDAWDAFYG